MSTDLGVVVVQMTSVDDIDLNLMQIQKVLEDIFKNGSPRLVCFPENCLYLRVVEGEKIQGLHLDHPAFLFLAELAKKYSTNLHLGSVPLFIEKVLYNSSVLVSPSGDVNPTYQKMHLFDIQLNGQAPIRESDVFGYGANPHVLNIEDWSVGESICYDLRFAELYSKYAQQKVGIILVPAAFLVETGQAHWEILLRARAIESQCYVLASAQGGVHRSVRSGVRHTYGHSLIIDPWGRILAEKSTEGVGYISATLSASKIQQVRQQIPMVHHRRI
jgi:predicted amidohydrolase